MTLDARRIRAVIGKELRDYRRNRFVVVTMAVFPVIFLALPIIDTFLIPATKPGHLNKLLGVSLLYLLLIPVLVPSTVAGYAVVGEREQGTLEPVLTTPIRREELILGKAAAIMIPALVIAYTTFGIFLALVYFVAKPTTATAVFDQGPLLVAQILFTPLLAAWAIWVGLAASARSKDVRVAQQLGTLGSLPLVAVTTLLSLGALHATFALAAEMALGLLAIDILAWRVVSSLFDRERLVTGAKFSPGRPTPTPKLEQTAKLAENPAATMKATLRLSRSFRVIGAATKVKILVDGETVGTVANHSSTDLTIDAGTHELHLVFFRGWLTSPKVTFDVGGGERVDFECHTHSPFVLVVPWLIVSLLMRHSWWLVLKRVSPAQDRHTVETRKEPSQL
jgi:hypothetical protein